MRIPGKLWGGSRRAPNIISAYGFSEINVFRVSQQKQKIYEANLSRHPNLILADSCSEIIGFEGAQEVPGRSKTSFRHTVATKSMILRGVPVPTPV